MKDNLIKRLEARGNENSKGSTNVYKEIKSLEVNFNRALYIASIVL